MIFDRIVSRFQEENIQFFDMDSSADSANYDYTETYIVPAAIDFFGVPSSDNDLYEYDCDTLPKIGTVTGSLILSKQMDEDGYDFYTVCDDKSSDLEHLASVLLKEGLPDDNFEMNPQNIFYIQEVEIEPDHRGNGYGSRILQELPLLILEYLHIKLGILAYIPTPLEGPERKVDDHELAVSRMLMETAAAALGAPETEDASKEDRDSNVVALPTNYQFDEDDINRVLGRRVEASAYSDERKNGMLFAFYAKNGFVEIANTKLMVKSIYD